VAAVGCLALAYLALARPAAAQEEPPRFIEVDPMIAAETGAQPWDVHAALREVRSRFALFGEGDRAFTSLRLVGDNRMYETNTGPGDEYYLWNGGPAICQYGTQFSGGCYFQSFGIPIMWAAPRSEWVNYLVEGVESMRNVRGEPAGFTVLWNGETCGRAGGHAALGPGEHGGRDVPGPFSPAGWLEHAGGLPAVAGEQLPGDLVVRRHDLAG